MSLFRPHPDQDFSEWLYIATRDLVPSARARIRLEIDAHYAEATALRMAEGMPELLAKADALADLGDAHAAARRLRREHLTTADVPEAATWGGASLAFGLLLLMGILHEIFLGDVFRISETEKNGLLCFCFLTGTLVCPRIRLTPRLLVLLTSLSWFNLGMFMVFIYVFPRISFGPQPIEQFEHELTRATELVMYALMLLAAAVWFATTGLRLRKKLAAASADDLVITDTNLPFNARR